MMLLQFVKEHLSAVSECAENVNCVHLIGYSRWFRHDTINKKGFVLITAIHTPAAKYFQK